MKIEQVAILGSGFPALIAAHAVHVFAKSTDIPLPKVIIYGSADRPVKIGAKWYEREIPMMPGDLIRQRMVDVSTSGEADDYNLKLKGPVTAYNRPRANFLAFDYHQTYQQLWAEYNSIICTLQIDRQTFDDLDWWRDFELIINTQPRPMFYAPDQMQLFGATRHWRLDEVEGETMQYASVMQASENFMIFDSTADVSWYRISRVFDLMSVEWPYDKKPPISGVNQEILPLGTPPELGLTDVEPDWRGGRSLAHIGPLARWRPCSDLGELYFDTMEILRSK